MMATGAKYALKLYGVVDGFVGKIDYKPAENDSKLKNRQKKAEFKTIVILDVSASMGRNVAKLATTILPATLQQLGYDKASPVTLITFGERSAVYETTVEHIAHLSLSLESTTYMEGAVTCLKRVIETIDSMTPIRLLTLSDGELHDQNKTVTAASALAPLFSSRVVNSRAVRYFTSQNQPDTRGLASVLQFNNVSSDFGVLVDVDSNSDKIDVINSMCSLFKDDGLDYAAATMTTSGENDGKIQLLPWDSKCVDTVRLVNGENIFWFKSIPNELSINGAPVEIEHCGQLTLENWTTITGKLQCLAFRLKLLKIVNSESAIEEIANAKSYLERWIKSMEEIRQEEGDSNSSMLLKNRLMHLKNKAKRQTQGILYQLAEIVNDAKIHALNSAQQASYLRSLDGGKLSKALARRAVESGLDFNDVLRKELINMRKHLAELADVDDSQHFPSFYSYATTLAGIKALCELGEDPNVLDSLEAMEILQIANIVGIACQSPAGDFPDPMTWRIHKIFPGCYISISDLISAFEQSGAQQRVTVPQTSEVITSVVPYFEDDRIQKFLQTFAPNLLEYTCSIGMRNVLACVPKTYCYTLAGGIWKLVQEIDQHKLEVNIISFDQLIKSFHLASGKSFNDVLECINKEQPPVNGTLMSFYLANNGIQNLIAPMVSLAKENRLMTPLLPRILRALYSYEAYLAIRKTLKNDDAFDGSVIFQLLGIDFDKFGTLVGELFADSQVPTFHSDYYVDDQVFDRITKAFNFFDYVTLLPQLIQSVFCDNPVGEIKAMPKMDDVSICKALGISTSLKQFKLFNILQAYLFDSQSKRSNENEARMNIIDLGCQDAAEQFVRDYVRSIYEDDYKKRINVKTAKENEIMAAQLVEKLLATQDLSEFKQLLTNGIMIKTKSHRIASISSLGFEKLSAGLSDMATVIPDRVEKIRIFLTGCDANGNVVWNRGSCLIGQIRGILKKVFAAMNEQDEWDVVAKRFKGSVHVYRDYPKNRHGHSNDKPSYWALGFETLQAYFDAVTAEKRAEYERVHVNCCGLGSEKK